MTQRFTLPALTMALAMGTFALAQSQPTPKNQPVSRPVTATGFVVGAPSKTEFNLRTDAGLYRVRPHSQMQMKEVRGGDRVRVYGRPLGRVITGANVKLLQAKASNIASDYDQPRVERLDGTPREGSEDDSIGTTDN